MNRGRITQTIFRTLFFVALVCLFSLTHPLIAQGGGGELPFPPPEPPAIPMLSLAAAPITLNSFPAPTTPLTVTITNQGTGPATNLTLQMDSGLLTLPISQTLGILEAGQSLTTTLSLEFIGYEVGEHSLLLTSDAISLTNPVQATAQLTLLEPISNPGSLTSPEQTEGIIGNEKGDDKGLPEFHLLQAQQPPTADYRGRVLTFSLTNSKGYDKDLTLSLSQWLPGLELSPNTLQLTYQPAEAVDIEIDNGATPTGASIPFSYDSGRATLTFTPQGDGEYALSTTGALGESMGGEAPEEPKGWVPTFNAPTTSLFTGSAAYQYPLLTPPGPGLFQPTLALSYSGAAGNGLSSTSQSDAVGFGWNLAGNIEVAQAVTICSWSGAACPANAYWYDEDPEDGNPGYVLPGLIELTLSLGGTGYELTHVDGPSQNGYSGRYTLKGNTSLYVEYCHDAVNPTSLCLSADNGDGTNNGLADDTTSQGYWVVKDSQNTLYRLGYEVESEQELWGDISNGSHMGPWAGANAPGHALRWRVDQVKDRFANPTDPTTLTTYTYEEYLPSDINSSWSNRVRAHSSYLRQIDYGFNQIIFDYDPLGNFYGSPPSYPEPQVVSWQTHRLTEIQIKSRDYETGSGTPTLIRSYVFTHLAERHGHDYGDPQSGITNQTSWCRSHYTAYWDWRLPLLTSITEFDANGQAKVRVEDTSHPGTYLNKPDVQFVYWWYKTGEWVLNENTYARYCAPYLTELHTPYLPNASVATFTYTQAPHVYHNANGPDYTTTWLNTISSQTLNSGWTTDAPVQVTQFTYTNPHYGGKASTDQWQEYTGAFQGFQDVTRTLLSGGVSHSLEVNHFLAYNFNASNNLSALTGSMDWQELRTPWSQVMARTEENWTTRSVTIPGTSPAQMTYIPSRNHTIQYSTYYSAGSSHNVGTRTHYTYDDYGNPEQVREYGSNTTVGTGTPYRVQETEYVHNFSPANWLIGLPWQVTTWAGDVDTGTIISRQRTRYDNATCGQAGSQTPTNGLPTATDVYIPGGGSGHCDLNYLTTIMNYGQNGDLWWQLTSTTNPAGQAQTINWRNHSTIEKIATSVMTTTFGFNDTHTPWLFTDKTAPNGAMSRYEYDNFGRLIKQYTPDAANGQATILSQQITYKDNAPWGGDHGTDPAMPLYIDTITVPGQGYSATSRTYYDALGRARQQRSWNLASDLWGPNLVNKVVTDTEYNDLGQAICQTTPIYTNWAVFNADLDCAGYDHTTTSYTRLGSPAISTGLDGLTSYGLALGRTSLGVDPLGRLSASNQDAYGRLQSVEEFNVTYDAFSTGSFNSSQWTLLPAYATPTTLNGQSVLRVGKTGAGGGTYAATHASNLSAGNSFFFRFQLSGSNHSSRIMLQAPDGSASLRLELYNGQIYPQYTTSTAGNGTATTVQIAQTGNVWYRAQISLDKNGQPTWRVWREDGLGDPGKQFTWTVTDSAVLNELKNKSWNFIVAPGTSDAGLAYLYLGAYQEGPQYITQYGYDAANNLLTVTDVAQPTANVTALTYDLLGRKLTMSDPDMGTWTYAYDLAGNLIRQTDANNNRLCFYYDDLNRLKDKYHNGTGSSACPGTPGGTWLASYYYHWSGMGKGQLSSIYGLNNNVGFNESFSYDYRGRVTTTNRTIAGTTYSLSTTYDLLDRPLALTYPGGEVVTTTYDKQVADTLQTSALPPNQPLVSNVTYNHRLEMTSMVLGNTVTQNYGYYPANGNYRLQTAVTEYTSGGNDIFSRAYVYDPVGNIKQITTGLSEQSDETQTFTYDSLGRLKTAKAVGGPATYDHTSGSTDYDYDAVGNITSLAGSTTYNYTAWPSGCNPAYPAPPQALPHAVKQVGSNYYCYDKNGNMTKRVESGVTYTQAFDVENRLKTVSLSNNINVTNFAYDASGQRLRTEVAPTTPSSGNTRTVTTYPFPGYEVEQRYTWQFGCPSEENCFWAWALTATITRKTYFLGGQAIATHVNGDPSSGNNGFFYLHSDHLGSTSLLTNSSGATVSGSETRYYPYGAQRLSPTMPADNITDRDFTGQKENSYIKLIYYNARWYDSQIGRFVSADTIVPQADNPQAYNRYSYVYNNPIRYTDPSGHCVFAPPVDTFICVALLALVLTGDTPVDKPVDGGPRVYPVNAPGQYVCNSPLPDCFGETVYLKDFEEYDEDNPMPIEEFEAFADEVAEDLHTHDLTWPGFTSGRAEYDTPFYNNGQSERRSDGIPTELWPADQQVCIETIRCSGRSEINYIAQGMWSAASGEPKWAGEVLVYGWKLLEYGESPSSDVWFWYHYGYDYYQAWLEEQEQEQ